MLQSRYLLISLIFFGSLAMAASPQRAFLEQFASSRISFPSEDSPLIDNPGRYPKPLNFLFEYVFNWSPTGEVKNFTPACATELWQERMKDPRLKNSLQLQGALVQKYFQDCRAELETGRNSDWINTIKIMSMNYQPQTHPFLRRVLINLPGNVKLKALLALKGDMKRRPLVIVRLGIFSNVEDFRPERAWLMMLFEQSPFNVLVVENMTSSDFIANNSQFSFGGYDEGIQNIHIARLLTSPQEPLSKIVDSVHLFGISLGGHGVLFSSLLNKYNSPAKQPLFNSFTAMCPVVDLKTTMAALTESGIRSAVVDLWGRQRLEDLPNKMPAIRDHENFKFMSKAISEIARTYQGGLSYISTIKLPPGMKDGSNFWELNNFWAYYENVQQPVVIYATQNDPAVPFHLNSQRLQNKDLKVDSKNIRVIDFPQGMHCTLPVPYDWGTLSTMFSSYILSHSPGFKLEDRNLDIELGDAEWKGFFDQGTQVSFTVQKPEPKTGFATVLLKAKNSAGTEKSMNLSLPLSQFDFRFYNPELSESEQEMIVRWLNQNLKIRFTVVNGKPVLRSSWKVAQ